MLQIQKNLKIFKKDFLPLCDAPDITPEKVQKRRHTCSKCGKVGHNIRKCPDVITEKMRLKTNISIVNSLQTPSELILPPVPNVSADDVNYDLNIDQTHLLKTVAPDPTDNVLKLNCPFCKKNEKMRLKTIISIVNSVQTPSELIPPVPNVSADDVNYDLNIDQTHLPKTVAPDPTDNVLKLNCPFCKKFLSNSSNGRPLLFCFDCQTSDSLRAPVQIPVEVSPDSSVPMSMEMRSFSSQLELNKWNITRFWKFFAKKNKKKINDKPKQRKANSSFQARKLFLRGRYGSGLKNIFSGKLTDNNLETVEKLKSLHPTENFCPSKPSVCQYWLENPFQAQEVLNAVAKLPKGKAAGPSGISFDLLKTACKNAPEICEDLASYFQNLMCLNYVPPHELTAARLVALVKPGKGDKPDGVRPIAIGESLTRLLSSLIFNRISTKARDYLKPFQFGTKTVEGASVASMTSDVFFNSQQHQYNFNLDFKNAFNFVKRNCIFDVLLHDFPELTAYFYLFYGKKSDLIFDSFTLESSSGVKQGDPLGPLLFCLAIHNIIKMTQQDFPDLRIVAYMDDISIIGSFESISRVSEDIAAKYKEIGLALTPSKCLLIGREKQSLMIGGARIPFINYDQQAFKFLGCWLGNLDEIYSQLNNLLEKFDKDLSFIAECDIEKHIKFFILKICYSGKFTHILRSTPPSKICLVISGFSVFLKNVQEIPTRSLPNLRFCLKKLQHHLVKLYEGLNYEVRLGLAKTKDPAFGNFLKDIRDSSAAALVTQVPSVYGLLLKDNEWLLNMRFRCFLWPNNLPNHLTCKCGKPLLFTHLLNCKHFITFRSKVHNNVRDQIYVMCKSYRVDSFLEPLLSKLILDDPNIDSTRYNRASMGLTRGDLVVPGLNGSFTILDAMSIDPCNSSNEHFINSDVINPLLAGEKYKIAKYAKPISSVNENSHAQYNLYLI
ncbi:hypothetical protein P9112_014420 [Eukaryota sp. TZLM1-RC]